MTKRRWVEASIWHLINRGVEKRDIFRSDEDREHFVGLMGKYSLQVGLPIHAFVLMGNHYHLLGSGDQKQVPEFERHLNRDYVMSFNRRWDRVGPLFQGRYKPYPVLGVMKAVELSCYIHRNPLTDNFVDDVRDYRWSSFRYYDTPSPTPPPAWLDTRLILDALQRLKPNGITDYDELLKTYRVDNRMNWLRSLQLETLDHLQTQPNPT